MMMMRMSWHRILVLQLLLCLGRLPGSVSEPSSSTSHEEESQPQDVPPNQDLEPDDDKDDEDIVLWISNTWADSVVQLSNLSAPLFSPLFGRNTTTMNNNSHTVSSSSHKVHIRHRSGVVPPLPTTTRQSNHNNNNTSRMNVPHATVQTLLSSLPAPGHLHWETFATTNNDTNTNTTRTTTTKAGCDCQGGYLYVSVGDTAETSNIVRAKVELTRPNNNTRSVVVVVSEPHYLLQTHPTTTEQSSPPPPPPRLRIPSPQERRQPSSLGRHSSKKGSNALPPQPVLIRPYGFAIDTVRQWLIVASFVTDQLLVYHVETGEFLHVLAQGNGTAAGLLNGPNHVALHQQDLLYVTTQGSASSHTATRVQGSSTTTTTTTHSTLSWDHNSQILVYNLSTGEGRVFATPQPLKEDRPCLSSSSSPNCDDTNTNNKTKNKNNNNNTTTTTPQDRSKNNTNNTNNHGVSMLGLQVDCSLWLPPPSNHTTTIVSTWFRRHEPTITPNNKAEWSRRCRLYTTDYYGVLRAYNLTTAQLDYAVSTQWAHDFCGPQTMVAGDLSIVNEAIYISGFDANTPSQPGFVQRFAALDGRPLPLRHSLPPCQEPPAWKLHPSFVVPPHPQLVRPIGIVAWSLPKQTLSSSSLPPE